MSGVVVSREEIGNYLKRTVPGITLVSQKENESGWITLGSGGKIWDEVYSVPEKLEIKIRGIGSKGGLISIPYLVNQVRLKGLQTIDAKLMEDSEICNLHNYKYDLWWGDPGYSGKTYLEKLVYPSGCNTRGKFLGEISKGIKNIYAFQELFPELVRKAHPNDVGLHFNIPAPHI